MRTYKYEVCRLEADALVYETDFCSREAAERFIVSNKKENTFFVVYAYVNHTKNGMTWNIQNSTLFFRGYPIIRIPTLMTVDDIKTMQRTLGRVYKTDGTMYFIANRQLTCADVKAITGGWCHIKVVKDEPERWALLYRDVDWILDKKSNEPLPPKNRYASKRWGFPIYGDVIYINENYI